MRLFGKDKKNKIGKKKLGAPTAPEKSAPPEKAKVAKTSKVKKNVVWSELSEEELDKNYNDLKKESQELRFKKVTSHVPNIRRIRFVKRSIARALTYKKQKQMKQASSAGV